jgi:hypothetical protein
VVDTTVGLAAARRGAAGVAALDGIAAGVAAVDRTAAGVATVNLLAALVSAVGRYAAGAANVNLLAAHAFAVGCFATPAAAWQPRGRDPSVAGATAARFAGGSRVAGRRRITVRHVRLGHAAGERALRIHRLPARLDGPGPWAAIHRPRRRRPRNSPRHRRRAGGAAQPGVSAWAGQ